MSPLQDSEKQKKIVRRARTKVSEDLVADHPAEKDDDDDNSEPPDDMAEEVAELLAAALGLGLAVCCFQWL